MNIYIYSNGFGPFLGWGRGLTIITILQTGETEAQKDKATCPRSPKKPEAEPESETEFLKIQSWVLGHVVPWEIVWAPVTSTKALCQAENHPQANLANMQTSAPTNDLVKPAVDLPVPCSRWRYMDLPACLLGEWGEVGR